MNDTHIDTRHQDLADSRAKRQAALAALDDATTNKAARDAADDAEFWSKKAAYLAAWIAREP